MTRIDYKMRGFTMFELLVSVLIVTLVSSSFAVFISSVLTLREDNREWAYVREQLSGICANFADCVSIGSSISNSVSGVFVDYRDEVGGVSIETGSSAAEKISHVMSMELQVNAKRSEVDRFINAVKNDDPFKNRTVTNSIGGCSRMIAKIAEDVNIISCTFTPLSLVGVTSDTDNGAALYRMVVVAEYVSEKDGLSKRQQVERVVRLWNRE